MRTEAAGGGGGGTETLNPCPGLIAVPLELSPSLSTSFSQGSRHWSTLQPETSPFEKGGVGSHRWTVTFCGATGSCPRVILHLPRLQWSPRAAGQPHLSPSRRHQAHRTPGLGRSSDQDRPASASQRARGGQGSWAPGVLPQQDLPTPPGCLQPQNWVARGRVLCGAPGGGSSALTDTPRSRWKELALFINVGD